MRKLKRLENKFAYAKLSDKVLCTMMVEREIDSVLAYLLENTPYNRVYDEWQGTFEDRVEMIYGDVDYTGKINTCCGLKGGHPIEDEGCWKEFEKYCERLIELNLKAMIEHAESLLEPVTDAHVDYLVRYEHLDSIRTWTPKEIEILQGCKLI